MVAEHKHDHNSNIVHIAKLTLTIRNLQKEMGLMAQKGWRCPGKKRMLIRAGNIHLLRNHFGGRVEGVKFCLLFQYILYFCILMYKGFYYAHSCEIGKT